VKGTSLLKYFPISKLFSKFYQKTFLTFAFLHHILSKQTLALGEDAGRKNGWQTDEKFIATDGAIIP
jgi:hypothetical protein